MHGIHVRHQVGWKVRNFRNNRFSKVFVESTKELDGGKLLIFEGHSTHLSEQVVSIAEANNIELLCLPAHTSSILQPIDVGVFKSVKAAWQKLLRTFYDETRYSNVDKKQFPKLLKDLDDGGAFSRTNAIHAFDSKATALGST